jgi:hypothetical protein
MRERERAREKMKYTRTSAFTGSSWFEDGPSRIYLIFSQPRVFDDTGVLTQYFTTQIQAPL